MSEEVSVLMSLVQVQISIIVVIVSMVLIVVQVLSEKYSIRISKAFIGTYSKSFQLWWIIFFYFGVLILTTIVSLRYPLLFQSMSLFIAVVMGLLLIFTILTIIYLRHIILKICPENLIEYHFKNNFDIKKVIQYIRSKNSLNDSSEDPLSFVREIIKIAIKEEDYRTIEVTLNHLLKNLNIPSQTYQSLLLEQLTQIISQKRPNHKRITEFNDNLLLYCDIINYFLKIPMELIMESYYNRRLELAEIGFRKYNEMLEILFLRLDKILEEGRDKTYTDKECYIKIHEHLNKMITAKSLEISSAYSWFFILYKTNFQNKKVALQSCYFYTISRYILLIHKTMIMYSIRWGLWFSATMSIVQLRRLTELFLKLSFGNKDNTNILGTSIKILQGVIYKTTEYLSELKQKENLKIEDIEYVLKIIHRDYSFPTWRKLMYITIKDRYSIESLGLDEFSNKLITFLNREESSEFDFLLRYFIKMILRALISVNSDNNLMESETCRDFTIYALNSINKILKNLVESYNRNLIQEIFNSVRELIKINYIYYTHLNLLNETLIILLRLTVEKCNECPKEFLESILIVLTECISKLVDLNREDREKREERKRYNLQRTELENAAEHLCIELLKIGVNLKDEFDRAIFMEILEELNLRLMQIVGNIDFLRRCFEKSKTQINNLESLKMLEREILQVE